MAGVHQVFPADPRALNPAMLVYLSLDALSWSPTEYADHAPLYEMHQGTPIPWSQCHNYMNSVRMVGPVGLEP